jgi:dGTPase
MLAAYAVRVENSRGRRHPEPEHRYRDAFQRDRDRVIHSRAFRRLENKTQVFTGRHSDHFRNRLTHTIEVAQISRTIAAALGLNTHLTEALALVHDIGHPPFGHAGEKALDTCMRGQRSFFDHNIHALRIVEDFEQRYIDFRGLNLTFEVREGIIKHSRDYDATVFPELAEYDLDLRPPLEAQLIDLTDEIAYNTADLDDGYEARILSIEQMRRGAPIFAELYAETERAHPTAPEKLKFNEAQKRILDRMVTDLITTTHFRVLESGAQNVEDVRRHAERLAAFSVEMDSARRELKAFLYEQLYYSGTLRPEKDRAEIVVTDLFEYYLAHPESLPHAYHEAFAREPHRVVCDYIAGMTDNFILHQHRQFVAPDKVPAQQRS